MKVGLEIFLRIPGLVAWLLVPPIPGHMSLDKTLNPEPLAFKIQLPVHKDFPTGFTKVSAIIINDNCYYTVWNTVWLCLSVASNLIGLQNYNGSKFWPNKPALLVGSSEVNKVKCPRSEGLVETQMKINIAGSSPTWPLIRIRFPS